MLLADFDFMGERARIDDLALTLWCARCDLAAEADPAADRARLGRLVAGYDAGLDIPLSETERAALPVAMARQPLSSIGGWVARLDDPAAARRHAASVGPELAAALEIMTELGAGRTPSPEPHARPRHSGRSSTGLGWRCWSASRHR